MPIRLSGLASGLDTEAIVGALVSAYSYKKDKYTKAQTKLSWKQDAWKTLNSKVYSMYTEVGNMRYSSNYALKKATVSDTTKATATASGTAINGTQSLEVKQLATTAYITGGKLTDNINGDSSLSTLGIKSGTLIGSGTITVRTGTKVTDISLDATMSVDQLVGKFNEAGVQANYDAKNHRFYVSAKTSGTSGDFSISAKNSMGLDGLMKLGLMTDSEITSIKETLNSTTTDGETTTTTAVTNLIKKSWKYNSNSSLEIGNADDFAARIEEIKEAKAKYAELKEHPVAEGEEGYAAYVEELDKYEALVGEGDHGAWNSLISALETKYSITDWSTVDADDLGQKMYKDAVYDEHSAEQTSYEIGKAVNAVRDKYVKLSEAYAMPQETDAEKAARNEAITAAKAGIDTVLGDSTNAKWAEYIQKNFGAKNSGSDETDNYAYSDFWTQSDNLELSRSVFYRVDLAAKVDSKEMNFDDVNTATKVDGKDAEIVLNGVKYTGSTNAITVNGLTIEAMAVTAENSPITITVNTDTDGLYDKVKDFLTSYNNLITEMQKLYNADSAKDYEPLTDDEKKELSETEIEKWEQKIKDSLLRRDTSLNSLISTMTMSMMKTIEIDGKKYSWSTFGIHTLGTLNSAKNENYNYHIDGDPEDSKTSGNEEKLRAALAEEPETVIEFLKQMATGLYTDLDKKMKSTAVKSVYTVYNDKEMASEYSNYNNLIKTWTDRVNDMEESYYKKFSEMEKALAQLQSNSSSISSLLGG